MTYYFNRTKRGQKIIENFEAKNQTKEAKHQDPLARQIYICLEKFGDVLGGHITTLANNISENIINGMCNCHNLRVDKRAWESKKRTHFSRARVSEEDNERSNRCTRKKLPKSCSRDKFQRQGVQKWEVKVHPQRMTYY